jgi:hypothetical protein
MIFAVEDSPVYLLGGFDLMAAMIDNQPKVEAAFRSGGGSRGVSRLDACFARWRASSAPATTTI